MVRRLEAGYGGHGGGSRRGGTGGTVYALGGGDSNHGLDPVQLNAMSERAMSIGGSGGNPGEPVPCAPTVGEPGAHGGGA